MIEVSEEFKTAMKASAKELKGYITTSSETIDHNNDLKGLKITSYADLSKTVMRSAEAIYYGDHNLLDQYVNLGIGVVLPDTSIEYIDYGSFYVESFSEDKKTETTRIKMLDKMRESLQKYDLEPTYPITLLELLQLICTRLDWELETTVFPNYDKEIPAEIFLNQGLVYRNILDDIAEASSSIIMFNNEDKLVVKQISGTIVETLDKDLLKDLTIEKRYGPINSVVLSRMPQEDNIAQTSEDV